MAGGHHSPVLLLCCIKGETVDREIGFLGEIVGGIRGLVIVEPKNAFSGGASRHLAVSPRQCWPCKGQVRSMARSPPQPSLLMGDGVGGGEIAAHDTGIVSHSAAVPHDRCLDGSAEYYISVAVPGVTFYGVYSSVVRGRVGAAFLPLHRERAGVRGAQPLNQAPVALTLPLSRTERELAQRSQVLQCTPSRVIVRRTVPYPGPTRDLQG